MNIIVAVDQNWAIGKDGDLLAHIKEDMQFFKNKTIDQVVIMGRKTLESFPGKKALSNRVNIVITNDKEYKAEGVEVVHSIDEAIRAGKKYMGKEIFVIGGESIYRQMLDLCDTAFVTKIDKTYEADTYFPNLEQKNEWKIVEQSEKKEFSKGTFSFLTYKK